ncbi:MAG: hypothetical protein P8K83_03950 [Woeseiaceae bacterium]|nr:hypothetical protein [Woeseiaceae bacterium]
MTTHSGGYYCGRIRFKIDVSEEIKVAEYNCSMCGFLYFEEISIRMLDSIGVERRVWP